MRKRSRLSVGLPAFLFTLLVQVLAPSAWAQNQGFQINRYEPTAPGESSFLIDHPWYSSTRYFSGGITLNYAHAPLVLGLQNADGSFARQSPVIEHQLLGHVDLAGSFLDRVTVALSLPVTLYEAGMGQLGITPLAGVAVGDPRFGLMVRIFGQPDRSPISLSVGGQIWVPLRKFDTSLPEQSSDSEVRGLPKLVLAGLGKRVRWSFTFGALIRPEAILGTPVPEGPSTGTSIQFGALVQYADPQRRFAVGPEALLDTVVTEGRAFAPDYTSLELLLGGHYNIANQVQIGVAGGLGIISEPGTPDGRVLFRLSYAPFRKPKVVRPDTDPEPVRPPPPPVKPDPPPPVKPPPPPVKPEQQQPVKPEQQQPVKPEQQQPEQQQQPVKPDPPSPRVKPDPPPPRVKPDPPPPPPPPDRDGDGIPDVRDACPDKPAGMQADPKRPGCPDADRDGDSVPDSVDACPDKPGSPRTDAKKNGCPGLVEVKAGLLQINRQVFFKTGSAEVDTKKSRKVLEAVASALTAKPEIKKVEVAGLADDKGKEKVNLALSEERAQSVRNWLIEHGIAADRVVAKGYGEVAIEKASRLSKRTQRKKNRRGEFLIIDPPQAAAGSQTLEPPERKGKKPKPEKKKKKKEREPKKERRSRRKK